MPKAKLEVMEGKPLKPKSGEQFRVDVQFNPQSLRINHRTTGTPATNMRTEQSEKTSAPAQQTGNTSSLTVELLFDTTTSGNDVRKITLKIADHMIRPDVKAQGSNQSAPESPIVRFSWGTFLFIGTIQSMDETLDFFSEAGVPLRATVNLSMNEVSADRGDPGAFTSGGAIGFSASAGFSAGASAGFSAGASLNAGIAVGTTPLTLSQSGDTLQGLAGRAGVDASWKAIATANNIDNPRLMDPGTVLNLNARASASGGFNV